MTNIQLIAKPQCSDLQEWNKINIYTKMKKISTINNKSLNNQKNAKIYNQRGEKIQSNFFFQKNSFGKFLSQSIKRQEHFCPKNILIFINIPCIFCSYVFVLL